MSGWAYFWIFAPPVFLVVIGIIYYLITADRNGSANERKDVS